MPQRKIENNDSKTTNNFVRVLKIVPFTTKVYRYKTILDRKTAISSYRPLPQYKINIYEHREF